MSCRLHCGGRRSGTFSLVNDGALIAFLGVTANYDANNAYLKTAQTRSLSSAAVKPSQVAVSTALPSLPTGILFASAAANLPTDAAARDAFNQLSGDLHASIKGAMLDDSHFIRNAVFDRLQDTFCTM